MTPEQIRAAVRRALDALPPCTCFDPPSMEFDPAGPCVWCELNAADEALGERLNIVEKYGTPYDLQGTSCDDDGEMTIEGNWFGPNPGPYAMPAPGDPE